MTVGQRIRETRKKLKLTQNEFSKSIDISETALCQIEKGAYMPSLKVIQSICVTHNISANYLVLGNDNQCGISTIDAKNSVIQNNSEYNNSEVINKIVDENTSLKNEMIKLQNKVIELLEKK